MARFVNTSVVPLQTFSVMHFLQLCVRNDWSGGEEVSEEATYGELEGKGILSEGLSGKTNQRSVSH